MQNKKTKLARRSKLAAGELTADELVRADIWQRVETGPGRPPRFEHMLVWLPARPSSVSTAGRDLIKPKFELDHI